jgi:hypothetical protein
VALPDQRSVILTLGHLSIRQQGFFFPFFFLFKKNLNFAKFCDVATCDIGHCPSHHPQEKLAKFGYNLDQNKKGFVNL